MRGGRSAFQELVSGLGASRPEAATMIAGRATPTGTRRYADRFPKAAPGHFRLLQGLTASSIGLGTYPGPDDETTDRLYATAIERALALGCNMLDTAVAYRNQRSERVIGQSLRDLLARSEVSRDEVIIASKAGFLPFDSAYPGGVGKYYEETFVRPNIVTAANFVAPGHCIAPQFIRHQIETSRQNLNCATVDIYYLHNPEAQYRAVEARQLYGRIRAAFEELETAVADGHIGMYGISTWSAFRVGSESREYLSLADLIGCARDVAEDNHHCRVIMLPLNGMMTEGADLCSQRIDERSGLGSLLRAARAFGVSVVAGSSLNGGRLVRASGGAVVEPARGTRTPAQRALQLVRSTPGVTTALVGMRDPGHVDENLELAMVPPMLREPEPGTRSGGEPAQSAQ